MHAFICRVPEECSREVADLFERCCAVEAAARPTAVEIMHFIASYLGTSLREELSPCHTEAESVGSLQQQLSPRTGFHLELLKPIPRCYGGQNWSFSPSSSVGTLEAGEAQSVSKAEGKGRD
jgi:hypothetical protein